MPSAQPQAVSDEKDVAQSARYIYAIKKDLAEIVGLHVPADEFVRLPGLKEQQIQAS